MKEKLQKIRESIDDIDKEIVALLGERISLVGKVAELKKEDNHASYIKADREARMVMDLLKSGSKIPSKILIQIWRIIISMSLQQEKQFKIHAHAKDRVEEEKIRRLCSEYFSVLSVVEFSSSTPEQLSEVQKQDADIIIFDMFEAKYYNFLIANSDYKIFARIPDLSSDGKPVSLSNYLVAAKVRSDSFALEKLFVSVDGAMKDEVKGEAVVEIEKDGKKEVILEISKDSYDEYTCLGENVGKISLLGGSLENFT